MYSAVGSVGIRSMSSIYAQSVDIPVAVAVSRMALSHDAVMSKLSNEVAACWTRRATTHDNNPVRDENGEKIN